MLRIILTLVGNVEKYITEKKIVQTKKCMKNDNNNNNKYK